MMTPTIGRIVLVRTRGEPERPAIVTELPDHITVTDEKGVPNTAIGVFVFPRPPGGAGLSIWLCAEENRPTHDGAAWRWPPRTA